MNSWVAFAKMGTFFTTAERADPDEAKLKLLST
jgi:hypothetical protein